MKNLMIVLILFVSSTCFASKKGVKKETSSKYSYEQYIDIYGRNDTTKAIIELFFDKREFSAGGKMSFLPISMGVTLIAPPIGIGLIGVSSPLFLSGIITRKRYSHKNLINVLEAYSANGRLPKNIKKQVRKILIAHEDYEAEELTERSKMALRPQELSSSQKNTILVVK